MTTGLDTFDKTEQESNLWLKDVMERLNTYDRRHAYSTMRAVLHAVRDRIGPENAAHLGAQLPMLLRGLFYEGWDLAVLDVLSKHIDRGAAVKLAAILPQDLRRFIQSAARDRQRGAA